MHPPQQPTAGRDPPKLPWQPGYPVFKFPWQPAFWNVPPPEELFSRSIGPTGPERYCDVTTEQSGEAEVD